jgi:hypothetical protein
VKKEREEACLLAGAGVWYSIRRRSPFFFSSRVGVLILLVSNSADCSQCPLKEYDERQGACRHGTTMLLLLCSVRLKKKKPPLLFLWLIDA